ncbi:hypothetical protein GCM10011492_37800 [Flexivirga endophytica]|uniref:ABC3 transporter permease C-terminal domain-containing protein n=1 Tax=Flexivirga endophytica TaxID=1849103 RepID=A0A916TIH2_9MICO|nr:hypothetical protein GCM10011492_37800 [Flexivirga endophytica]
MDPLLTRSFQSAVVRFHTDSLGAASQQISFRAVDGRGPSLTKIKQGVDPRVRAVTGAPIESRTVGVVWPRRLEHVTLQATQGECAHVHLVSGRCPTARNEVALPEAQVKSVIKPRLRLGEEFTVKGDSQPTDNVDRNPQKQMKLVGVFTAAPDDPFWGGQNIAGYNPNAEVGSPAASWLTSEKTFAGHPPTTSVPSGNMTSRDVSWTGIYNTVSYPLEVARVDPSSLSDAVAGIYASTKRLGGEINVTEALSAVYVDTHTDTEQVGQILPFLLVQLGVVLLILLVQVTSFLATVRRGDAAVLKMRGNGTAGVLRLGAQELLPAWVAGFVGGLGLAYVVDELVRALWLPGGVSAAWVWTSLLAAIGTVALAAGVWCVCWWLMAREPISTLLRARPTRRRGVQLSTPAAVLGALCLVGVTLTATKSLTGAPVQVTPLLLAGLVAVIVGVLLAPVAAALVRRLLGKRRAAGALAVAQLGRRAGVVTAIATLIITSALLTLSVSVFARGADNRQTRAAADVGAPALVRLDQSAATVHPSDLMKAIDAIDPKHHDFTPAVQINAATSTSEAVLGVVPADMDRIGLRTGLPQPVPWSALEGTGAGSDPAALVATWTTNSHVGSTVSAPTMADVDGPYRVVGTAPYIPGAGSRTIVVDLAQMAKVGDRMDNVSYQVFSATQNPAMLKRLDAAVRKVGFAGTQVQTLHAARAGYDATATAWAMNLSIVVSALSVLAALVSMVLVAVASRRERQRDLRALRTGGLSRRVLRTATVGEFVLLAFVGSVIGAATAPLAAWLTGRTMLWWSTPPDQPLTRTGFEWLAGVSAAIALIVLLLVVATVFGTRVARSASYHVRGTEA